MSSKHENETVRDLLEAVLRKLDDKTTDQSAIEDRTSPKTLPSHPGLERFTMIENSPVSSGQKPCYMEPDRPCVKSGACEMRGY
jgi:hypothetical protein